MLGHRGCRLGNTYPRDYRHADKGYPGCCHPVEEGRFEPQPEMMVPLIGIVQRA